MYFNITQLADRYSMLVMRAQVQRPLFASDRVRAGWTWIVEVPEAYVGGVVELFAQRKGDLMDMEPSLENT
jgi:predicted membrane GTPase involved in stress response